MIRRHSLPAVAVFLLFSLPFSFAAPEGAGHPPSIPPYANGALLHTLHAVPVSGEPYSATVVHRTVRTLPDGSVIRRGGHHFIARDSDGRVRIELRVRRGKPGHPDGIMVFVLDPVARTLTIWSTGIPNAPKVAMVAPLPDNWGLVSGTTTDRTTGHSRLVITSQTLPDKAYEGLNLTGERITIVFPPHVAGNSAAITRTHDVWISPALRLIVAQTWTDPRFGKRMIAFRDISRAEPDPSLFHPPADYAERSAVQQELQTLRQLEQKLESEQ